MTSRAAAERCPLNPDNHPAWQAALNAPLDDEPETAIEKLAIEDAMRTGVRIPGAVISAEIAARAAREG